MKKEFFLLAVLATSISTISEPKSAIARTALPMRLQHAEGTYTITVPDRNTTRSAFGGRLRLYDVHIAKMFEVTYSDCQEMPEAGSRTWYYFAGNGNIDMGEFTITCELANNIANAYGLGRSLRTTIEYSQEEAGPPISTVRSIPTLDITGSKIPRWLNFVQRFRPVRR